MFCRWAQSDFGIFTHLHVLPLYLLVRVFSSEILCLIWLPASLTKNPTKNERASLETIRILHGREVQTENSVPSHYLASRG